MGGAGEMRDRGCYVKGDKSNLKFLVVDVFIKYTHSKNAVKTSHARSGAEINKFLVFCHFWPKILPKLLFHTENQPEN